MPGWAAFVLLFPIAGVILLIVVAGSYRQVVIAHARGWLRGAPQEPPK